MHEDIIERGNAADLLLNVARYEEAESAYQALYDDALAAGPIDMRVAAKIALGMLVTLLESGQVERAHQLWTSRPSDPLGEGIFAIEHGMTSRADLWTYQMASSFLHALAVDDRETASASIDARMQAVCDDARVRDPALLPVAIKNWQLFLLQLHGDPVPERARAQADAEEARQGRTIVRDGVDFPPPSPWNTLWPPRG